MVSLRTRSPSSGRVSPAPTPLASSRPPVPHVRNGAIPAGFGLGLNPLVPPGVGVTAAEKILDRALGKPAQTVDVTTRKDDALDYSIADLVDRVSSRARGRERGRRGDCWGECWGADSGRYPNSRPIKLLAAEWGGHTSPTIVTTTPGRRSRPPLPPTRNGAIGACFPPYPQPETVPSARASPRTGWFIGHG